MLLPSGQVRPVEKTNQMSRENKTLLGFNDLGRSVTPTFLFRNRFYLQLSPHGPIMNKKPMWEVKKNLRFLSTGHGIKGA